MGNREFKLKLWQQSNGECYWCGKKTILLNVPEFKGPQPHDLATIDHLISRYHPERYVRRDKTKVLSCYQCNETRSRKETLSLSKEELIKRGQGWSLNPRGKPIFIGTLDSLDAVLDKLKENGIVPYERTTG